MKKYHLFSLIIFCLNVIQFNEICAAGVSDDDSKEKPFRKHSIELKAAYHNQKGGGVTVNTGPLTVNTNIGGVGGKIVYSYYPNYNYSFYFSISGSSPEVTVNTFSNYSSSIASVQMGVKYFLLSYQDENFFRPYFTGAMQMLIGSESQVQILNIGTHTESAVGAFVGFGAELLISSRIKVSTEIGYNLVSDFIEEIGSQKNYSGTEFSFGFGFMF